MPEIWVLYSTFATRDEAFSAARTLLDERLIACANVMDGAVSLYRWQGEVRQEGEAVMIAKTSRPHVDAAVARLKALHGYDVPCVVAWPLAAGHAPFLDWVAAETERA